MLHIREKVKEFEDSLATTIFPTTDTEYENKIRSLFQEASPQELRKGVHYRKMIFLLHFGNAHDAPQLDRLRQGLSYNRNKYHTFAVQIQRLYKVLSNEVVHGSSSIGIKHIDINQLSEYLKFFSSDIKNALELFVRTL